MNTLITKALISTLAVMTVVLGYAAALHVTKAATYAQLTAQMHVGSSGTNVTNLQTFLASNHDIYPEGRVTGYYGLFTQKAVMQFQIAYGLPAVGVVGPLTLAKINNVIATGYGLDIYAPAILNVVVAKTTTTATVTWTTSEVSLGKVFYSTTPFSLAEAQGSFQAPGIVPPTSVSTGALLSYSQSASITGLQANTTYYYIVEAMDASGNVSVTNQTTFMTNP